MFNVSLTSFLCIILYIDKVCKSKSKSVCIYHGYIGSYLSSTDASTRSCCLYKVDESSLIWIEQLSVQLSVYSRCDIQLFHVYVWIYPYI